VPRPVDSRATYLPGLDGVRAVAVIAVLGYHFGVPHMDGGLLGVSVFFTLSGFLITGILITAWQRTGRIPLGRFYLGRARRLLPALAVVLLTVLAVTALVDRSALAKRWDETVAAGFYVSNWFTIRTGSSYFDLFSGPSPLEHLWSLAVEEQFYLIWPLLLLVLLKLTGGRKPRVALIAAGLAAVSFLLLAVFAHPGIDNTRAYEGTDTRAGELLVGAATQIELELMVEAGLKPEDALRAATMNAARMLGKEQELGTVEAGKAADLVILDADPRADIRNVTRIVRTFKGGVPYDPVDSARPVR